ncbi:FAD-binding and (Fe-S)-binding domain-containing protein [Thermophagus xiamenensis]|uniref:Fe-S oxidoreductase n=1 Tax=Thermophagus xiamenensis TaxID=385682 RepID=A0A1I2DX92_9BACT|nr:FAD-binding and (Fe-S)-binding domain-containing protein [Thermophagus xiamenensis]SFE84560.1 Fe-S oxidoreductase [Thermophagus xiamenensis]
MKPLADILSLRIKGKVFTDELIRALYATDASVYREMPLAVVFPQDEEDIRQLILFARENKVALIPRTAGTSLAGQVVGNGIVVDVSRTFTRILEVNTAESWVRVQPGVVRDELNLYLAEYGLFFGPETSTSNRAMIGGMVGNNSCGANSLVYGSTRDNILEVTGFLSDGSKVVFKELTVDEFAEKSLSSDDSLEAAIYRQINGMLSNPVNQKKIEQSFPKSSVHRRNTGYALDVLARSAPFKSGGPNINLAQLIAGSEGTLMFITEIKLKCHSLPPKEKGVLCIHFHSVEEALKANLAALRHRPTASELMDDFILNCTKNNPEQNKNRFFIDGDPKALLVVEFTKPTKEEIEAAAHLLTDELKKAGLGYHYPLVTGTDIKRVWSLRKAALGVLFTTPGDAKPVAVIEDTSVAAEDLPNYVTDIKKMLQSLNTTCVFYGHAGTGELHLRPLINLKTGEGHKLFRKIAEDTAKLVKKYRGSLSGEHGDGRLRGEFIRYMVGDEIYSFFKELKRTWDPNHIFNPGKIVETPPMDTSLRYNASTETPEIETIFDFSRERGYIRAAEFCNGSGDCRKTHLSGGTMCPSYMATRDEMHTTRARANILREYLRKPYVKNRFNHYEIYRVMDLCLSCKACKSECPSGVDVTKLKAEFLQHYYEANGVPFRTRLIANISRLNALASLAPALYNFVVTNSFTTKVLKHLAGFASKRSLPLLNSTTLSRWYRKEKRMLARPSSSKGKVLFFNDEFTNYNDAEIGRKAVLLLNKLGYEVIIPPHVESGRACLSKGLLKKARNIAIENINQLSQWVSEEVPLVGLEPSALLTFRDEYIDLVPDEMKPLARNIARNALLFEEFLLREVKKGNVSSELFVKEHRKILLHGHCHQKSLASVEPTVKMLSLPENYKVEVIPSGCCGMAGSFGYEKEHYEVSMKIGELVLFPTIRKKEAETLVAAPGTSCRHQIKDGTGERAYHPVEILYDALREK